MTDSLLTGLIDHVGVSVSDFDTMVEWYKDAFGLTEYVPERLDVVEDGRRIRVALLSGPGGFRLEVMARDGSQRSRRDGGPVEGLDDQSIHHWAFTVSDLDAAFERLTAAGATIAYPPHEIREISVRYGHVADPEGNLIELVEPAVFDEVLQPPAGSWRRLRWDQARRKSVIDSISASGVSS